MMSVPDWWQKPRRIAVVIDNPSWIVPYGEELVASVNTSGDKAVFCRDYDKIKDGDVVFYLGCFKVTPPAVLARHRYNLVVHASDLPRGRGWSPLTWEVLEGRNEIPVCLFEAVDELDAGPIIYRETIRYEGHELIDEMRAMLGCLQIELCRRFLTEPVPPKGTPQKGNPTFYSRRRPSDSRLDPHRSLAEQFSLLRTVDNTRYPAFFELRGYRYKLTIEKI